MTGMNEYVSATRLRRATPVAELCVVVGCHSLACAIPTRYIAHLALNEDATAVAGTDGRVIKVAREYYATSNLGPLLELPLLADAWVLLHLPTTNGSVPIALRTGPCLVVRDVAVEAPLSPTLFKYRGEAVAGAFVAGQLRGYADDTLYGLVLNAHKLWTAQELAQLQDAVASAKQAAPDG